MRRVPGCRLPWRPIALAALVLACSLVAADPGTVRLQRTGGTNYLQVIGDPDDDWRIQYSSDLTNWLTNTAPATLLSGRANPPTAGIGAGAESPLFFRALKTSGLYDPTLFRTISLTFTQANWSTLLSTARTYESNIYCSVVSLDNGATNYSVGARYKGNTSYTMAGVKKSINLEFDYLLTNANLMTYKIVNLNNAFGDETIMREPVYFTVMEKYTPCPKGSMCQVWINGALWGVYSLVQQEDGELINEWFPSNDGDRWRAPNMAGGGPGSDTGSSAFAYLGNTNITTYRNRYILKTDNSPTNTAFSRLINAIYVLNNTATNLFRDKVEEVFAVDTWLWFLAIENLFADDDSYWNKGADFGFYYEIESGRIHPVEHDGNEAFMAGDVSLSPVVGGSNRPLLYRFLGNAELRQRYLAHMRTVLREYYNPYVLTPVINRFHELSVNAITADPRKGFTMLVYTNDLNALRSFVTNRYRTLTNHAELKPDQPTISAVLPPDDPVYATNTPFITAAAAASGSSGLSSVWLYYRDKKYGPFQRVEMLDDAAHGDGTAGDGIFGAPVPAYPSGTRVRYYVEARGANAAQAARFAPERAEHETYSYRVALSTAASTPVVINELLASNTSNLADPQGEYDDWIELRNLTDAPLDLAGYHLSDEPNNPRKWQFPAGTTIPADGYLLIWADEDTTDAPGLHASFKLSAEGEELFLADTDARQNQVLDHIAWGALATDVSFGRTAEADVWATMTPSPGKSN